MAKAAKLTEKADASEQKTKKKQRIEASRKQRSSAKYHEWGIIKEKIASEDFRRDREKI